MAIIETEDMEMVSIARNNLSTGHIKWADEQMDIVIAEDNKQEDMVIEYSGGEHVEMILVYMLGVEMVPEYEEMDKEMEPEDNVIKYCPGMEVVLPSYTFRGYNAHCSRICLDRIRYKQVIPNKYAICMEVQVYSLLNTLQT